MLEIAKQIRKDIIEFEQNNNQKRLYINSKMFRKVLANSDDGDLYICQYSNGDIIISGSPKEHIMTSSIAPDTEIKALMSIKELDFKLTEPLKKMFGMV